MIIYKDILTGDEMFSDAYPSKLVAGVVYEVDCKTITRKNGVDIDIGANASAEGGAEELDDSSVTVINVVDNFRLKICGFDFPSYRKHIKAYLKALKAHLTETGHTPEEVAKFEKEAGSYTIGTLLNKATFKDYEFYEGESTPEEPLRMHPLLNYRADGVTPYLIFWKHGLKEEKV